MKKIYTALAFAAAMLLAAWLGAQQMITPDMSSTLLIVLPVMWVLSLGRNGGNRCISKAHDA
ncbi:hypothetical protein [Alteraurantiacibacter aestuarii]|uniref:DUF2933 domain-containing protein n=1 Tax=Alteraurantiacibacter aestuarii TaxID=650004 RepID=A0A844ZML0_9SPHN|nr:hypothetical protein [Alteraurantiacibacter aestuarii]MXO89075.1 hypothetical protein [Alteraurantiacibacter aestuarii]